MLCATDPMNAMGIRSDSEGDTGGALSGPRCFFQALEVHGYRSYRFEKAKGTFEGPVEDTPEEWTNFFRVLQRLI